MNTLYHESSLGEDDVENAGGKKNVEKVCKFPEWIVTVHDDSFVLDQGCSHQCDPYEMFRVFESS